MKNKKEIDVIEKCMEKIRNDPGQKIIKEINSIRWSFKIFQGNYIEMIEPLKVIEDSPESIKLWGVKKKKELHRVLEEVGRLLFNYLAAAFMLIEHTRRYVDEMYKDAKYDAFKEDYKKEVRERFADNDNHQIAKGLRNYIQHRNLPAVGSEIVYTQETGLNKAFSISIDALLEWNGWSQLAREKLKAMGERFKISKFAKEYFQQVEDFHKWLWGRQVEMHREDIERLNRIKQEARKAFWDAGIVTEEDLKEFFEQFD